MFKMRKLEKGMMTVEASFLLPLIFFLLVLILYFCIFCYENGLAAGILREELEKAADVVKTEGDMETGAYEIRKLNERSLTALVRGGSEAVETQCRTRIRTKLLKQSILGTEAAVSVTISSGGIRGTVRSQIRIPLSGSVQAGGLAFFLVDQEVTAPVRMPAEQIRRWQQIE